MNTSSPQYRLQAAETRLTQALQRLETALQANPPSAAGPDQDALSAELQALQDENASLRTAMQGASERLDATIVKFKTQLAGQG